jgi:O-antigen/teichoic acid export membrane protein
MNLKERTLQGIAWSVITRIASQVIQFGVSVVLARLLFPADFGLVGMVGVFTGFAAVFIDFGIGSAIVQRPDLDERQVRAAFTATLVVGAVTTLLIAAGAPLIAAFYHRDELVVLTRVSALGFLLSSIGVVPRAMLMRGLQIKRLMLLDLAVLVASSACSVALALSGAGVWTVVVGSLVVAAGQSFLPVLFGPWKVGFAIDLRHLRPLMAVSLNLLGFNVINYWSRNVDNLLIGRLLGETSLGLYTRAYTLMLLPITQVTGVLSSSMMPMLSRVSHDRARSKNLFLRALGMIALVGFPMMLGLAAVAGPFVRAVYGPKWLELVPLLRLLAIVGALQMLTSPTGWIFVAQGRTDIMLRWGLAACSAIIVAICVGAYIGSALSVAIAYFVINLVLFAPCLALAGGLVEASLRDVFRVIGRPALYAMFMVCLVLAVEWAVPVGVPAWLRLAAEVAAGAAVYGAIVYRTKLESLVELMRHMRERGGSASPAEQPPQPEGRGFA